ncbi:MAG: FtsQ-type POTRA domain-containing protein [Candidatus Rokubacteria bacterium]|nr:FtsQ-type POTRA domain-containing protein [Candidatus Rokubacteria bacterium]
MNRGLLSPRGGVPHLGDLGERSALLGRQRVGRVRRPRPGRARRWRRRLTVTALTLGVLGGAGFGVRWLLTSPRFAVTGVEVRGASRVPVELILATSGIQPGTSLWRIDPTAVAGRLQALPEIRRAELIRELPNRVTILVEERRPFTLVASARLHWLDEEGRLIGDAPEAVAPPVPVISGLSEDELAAMRTDPSPRARAAVALIRSLLRGGSALAAEISEIDMSRRDGPVLYTVDGIEVRLGTEDWDERLARLEGVLAQVTGQGEEVRAIDLRFRDQVVLKKGGRG